MVAAPEDLTALHLPKADRQIRRPPVDAIVATTAAVHHVSEATTFSWRAESVSRLESLGLQVYEILATLGPNVYEWYLLRAIRSQGKYAIQGRVGKLR